MATGTQGQNSRTFFSTLRNKLYHIVSFSYYFQLKHSLIWYTCISSQNDERKSIFDIVLHCIWLTVVRVQRFCKIIRQSDPTKYLNTTNICRKWFRIVRHNKLYFFNYLLCPRIPRAKEPHTNLCMLYTAWFLMFKYCFCWKYQYKKYMFNFIDHLQFYFCECLNR